MRLLALAWMLQAPGGGTLPVAPRLAGIAAMTDSVARRAALDPLVSEVVTRAKGTERRLVERFSGNALTDSSRRIAAADSAARADLQRVLRAVAEEGRWGDRRIRAVAAVYLTAPAVASAMAAVYLREGRPDSAVVLLRRLAAREPENAAWYRELGIALLAAGKRAEGMDRLVVALDLDPTDDWTFRELVRLRQDEASLERLLVQVHRHRVRQPKNGTHVEREIELLQRLGRPDEAAAIRRAAMPERPS